MHDFTTPLTVEQMYGDWGFEFEDALALTERSLNPRSRSSIYDTFGSLGIASDGYVLDIGARDAAQSLDIAERFGCRVLAVDPVKYNVDLALQDIADHRLGHLVEPRVGAIEEIPADDNTFDAIFSRDMLGHVEDLDGALTECRRVLKPGGAMVIHDVFATDMLEPKEAARLFADLATVPARMDEELFVQIVERTGFAVETIDPIRSEWLEAKLEGEDGERRLLTAARMVRDRDRLVEEMGVIPFRVVEANNLWTIYRMIGKLADKVYVIRAN